MHPRRGELTRRALVLGVGAAGATLDAHPVRPGVLAITREGEHLVDLELAAMVRDDLRPSPQ